MMIGNVINARKCFLKRELSRDTYIKHKHDGVKQARQDCDQAFTQKASLQSHIEVVHIQKDIRVNACNVRICFLIKKP